MVVLLVLVFLIGVPHGALDFLVDEQNESLAKNKFSIKKFVSTYLFKLFAFSLFWLFPWIAFSLFILFSIYHFGETDMSSILKNKKNATFLYVVYGVFILTILLLSHLSEITATIPVIEPFIRESSLYYFLEKNSKSITIVTTSIFVMTIIWQKRNNNISFNIFQTIQFTVLVLIISLLPLLLAFSFYFALWHSILSVRNIIVYFKASNNAKKFKAFCGKSLLFSLLALGSIIGLYAALQYFMPQTNLLFALLIVLSVLTLPHLSVMHNMYQNFEMSYESNEGKHVDNKPLN